MSATRSSRVRVLGVACTRPLYRASISISPQLVEATGMAVLESDCCRLLFSVWSCNAGRREDSGIHAKGVTQSLITSRS